VRRTITFAAAIALFVIALAQSAALAQDLREGPLITTIIGGNELHIPRNYFLPRNPKGGRQVDFLLTALLPALKPMREDNMSEFLATRGFGQIVTILARDAGQTTTLESRAAVGQKLGAPYEQKEDKFGLSDYAPKNFRGPNDAQLRQELLLSVESGHLVSYIRCDVDGSVPFPGCNHEFVHLNLFFTLGYGKTQLPNWRVIEDAVKKLFDRFGRYS
jgi:hypothetical protein